MLRTLEIDNVYELYEDVTTKVEVDLLTPDAFDTEQEYEEYLDETVFDLTGVGHEDGNSAYFVRSIDGLDPEIDLEWC